MTINICFIFGFILCVFSFNIFVNKFLIKILEKKDSKKEGMLHSFITDRIESYSDNRPTKVGIFINVPYSYSKVSDKKLLIKARKLVDATNEFRYICGTKYIYVKDIKEQNKIFGSLFVKGNTSENSKLYDIILEER